MGIDFAGEFSGNLEEMGSEIAQLEIADDEEVDVAVDIAGACGDGAENEGEMDAGDISKDGAQAFVPEQYHRR